MLKVQEIANQEAEDLRLQGRLVGEELPHTESKWFDKVPIIRIFTPSVDKRYRREIAKLAKHYGANAYHEELYYPELVAGSEFPVVLQFYRR